MKGVKTVFYEENEAMQILCIILLVLTPVISWAASFDCKKAVTRIEKTLCSDPQLSRLDEELASAFKDARSAPRGMNAEPVVEDQKHWLKVERNHCPDAACLKKAYEKRIAELKAWNDPVAPDSTIFGNYELTSDNMDSWSNSVRTADCLTLRKSKGKTISYAFIHNGLAGSMCQMDEEARLKGLVYESTVDVPDADPPKTCTIRIHFTRRAIYFEDVGSKCSQQYFCGAQARIDGIGFLRDRKVRRECKPSF
jgi:uncharacterized protein